MNLYSCVYFTAAEIQRHVTEVWVAAESQQQRPADRKTTAGQTRPRSHTTRSKQKLRTDFYNVFNTNVQLQKQAN